MKQTIYTLTIAVLASVMVPTLSLAQENNVGIGTTAPGSLLHLFSEGNFSRGISIGSPGLQPNQQSYLELITFGDGTSKLGTVDNKGWHLVGRGAAYGAISQQNDLVFAFWNGISWSNRMFIKHTGNVGIGTSSPLAHLHVKDSSVLFSATINEDAPTDVPESGVGSRMFWYGDKAAFRSGNLSVAPAGTYWDKDSIGVASFATGINVRAKGFASVAIGVHNEAIGSGSFAAGNQTIASGVRSTAFGFYTRASGGNAFAIGQSTVAEASNSISVGRYNVGGGTGHDWIATDPIFEIGIGGSDTTRENAMTIHKNGSALWGGIFGSPGDPEPPAEGSGTRMMWFPDRSAFRAGTVNGSRWDLSDIGVHSVALGYSGRASGFVSTALGFQSNAVGVHSLACGSSTYANGNSSSAFGAGTDAHAYASFALGQYNTGLGDTDTWVETDPLFEIGIGTAASSRANALTVLKNGNTGIGTDSPDYPLHVISSSNLRSGYFFNDFTSASTTYGLYGGAFGSGSGSKRGGSFDANGGTGTNIGVRATAIDGSANIGVYGYASGGTTNWAAHFDNGDVIVDDRIGIGTTSPTFPLYATTSSYDRTGYFYNSRSTSSVTYGVYSGAFGTGSGDKRGGAFEAWNGTGQNIALRAVAANGNTNIGLYASASGGSSPWAAHFDDGYVIIENRLGIGTSTPGTALHVNGVMRIGSLEELSDGGALLMQCNSNLAPKTDNSLDIGTSAFRWDNIWATNGVIQTSDRNDKTNINELNYGLDEIMRLEPVTYQWKSAKDRGLQIGLVAQDVLVVLPEVVLTEDWVQDEEGNVSKHQLDRLGMRYSSLVPVLIKGMQEQQDQIDQLARQNLELRKALNMLETRVNELSTDNR